MTEKKIIVCDGCEKEVKYSNNFHLRKRERGRLYLETDYFWNGIENTNHVIALDFCEQCAKEIKETLNKIAQKLEESSQ